jgi:hypothetical protein
MHYQEGGLSDADADAILDRDKDGRIAVNLDYVHGRACKMIVFRDTETGRLYVRKDWYDHSRHQLKELLGTFGIDFPEKEGTPEGLGTAA